MDKYSDFQHLRVSEREEVDYRIRWRMGNSGIAILSIHGGDVEPGTSEIADAIAGNDHTFYAFEGLKHGGNKALHITSTVFDEPRGLEIVCQAEIILSIHGCSDTDSVIYLGGLDQELREKIRKNLCDAGFEVSDMNPDFQGINHTNICNLCGRGMGVQMEISRGLRSRMFKNLTPQGRQYLTETFYRFIRAVRETLEPFKLPVAEWVCEGLER